MSSAMISSGLIGPRAIFSSSGTSLVGELIFSSWIRTQTSSGRLPCRSWSVTKCGAEVAAVELHPFDHVDRRSRRRPSSTVITPSLPTFWKASASFSPIVLSLLAAIAATSAISFFPSMTFFDLLLDVLDDGLDGLVDPALDGHRVGAGGAGA